MNTLNIRPYVNTDQSTILSLLAANTPQWFDPSERAELVHYLMEEREDYFVLEIAGRVVGCGGINYFPTERAARISWDILHPDFQGCGYGSLMLQYRLALLRKNATVDRVIVRTSQLVYPFYQKVGFQLVRIVENFWAEGYDLYEMQLWIGK